MNRIVPPAAALSVGISMIGAAHAESTEVSLLTNWVAQAEHGGYYQALATGLYEEAGLDVTIRMGGPQVNTALILANGAVDFAILSNNFIGLNYVREEVPMVAVAAFFQRDPQCLMAHAGKYESIADMKGAPIEISTDAMATWWPLLRQEAGLSDEQIRPYNFTLAPLLANEDLVQQCYVTVSPYQFEDAGGDPDVFMFDEVGYAGYSGLLFTSLEMVEERPDVVRAMVDATIEGWRDYLYGDPSPANALILEDNPDYTPKKLEDSRAALIAEGIVDDGSGALVGSMTEARWQAFFDSMVETGLYDADLAWRDAFTTRFLD